MSPMQIWSNEAQERYVLAIRPESLESFSAICERERCPYAVVGMAAPEEQLVVMDPEFENRPVDMESFGVAGQAAKNDPRRLCISQNRYCAFFVKGLDLREAAYRVLAVACRSGQDLSHQYW